MAGEEMSPAELGRALARVEAELSKIDGKIDRWAESFVRKDVFELNLLKVASDNAALASDIASLERKQVEDRQRLADQRRLVWTSLVAPVMVAIIAALLIATLGVR